MIFTHAQTKTALRQAIGADDAGLKNSLYDLGYNHATARLLREMRFITAADRNLLTDIAWGQRAFAIEEALRQQTETTAKLKPEEAPT